MTINERFAERLWGYVRENRDSLDSERWCRKITAMLDEQLLATITPLKTKITSLKLELKHLEELLQSERELTNVMQKKFQAMRV
jgi:hypothetical protein